MTVNCRLLRAEIQAMRQGRYGVLNDASPLTELYEGYERSLTEIAPLLRNDGQALNRLVDIPRNTRLANELIRRHETLKSKLFLRRDALLNFWNADSVLYLFHRRLMGVVECPDTKRASRAQWP